MNLPVSHVKNNPNQTLMGAVSCGKLIGRQALEKITSANQKGDIERF